MNLIPSNTQGGLQSFKAPDLGDLMLSSCLWGTKHVHGTDVHGGKTPTQVNIVRKGGRQEGRKKGKEGGRERRRNGGRKVGRKEKRVGEARTHTLKYTLGIQA